MHTSLRNRLQSRDKRGIKGLYVIEARGFVVDSRSPAVLHSGHRREVITQATVYAQPASPPVFRLLPQVQNQGVGK